MQTTEIIITNILPTGTGFGVISDGMTQNVFIPSKMLIDKIVSPGDRVQAMLVPNPTQPEKTPWLAISIIAETAAATAQDLRRLILDDLENCDGSDEEIARSIKMPVDQVRATLLEMTAAGLIVRMETFGIPGRE